MASEFRRSFKQKAKEAFGLPFRFRMRLENVDSEDPGSKTHDGKSSEEFATRSASFDFGYFSPSSNNSKESDAQLAIGPTLASTSEDFVMIETQNKKTKTSKSSIQPKGTLPYMVSSTDSLASIAARSETTTSELKTLNRLMSNMVFPGKIIYIPDKNYIPSDPSDSKLHPETSPSVTEAPSERLHEEKPRTVSSDHADEASKLVPISIPDPIHSLRKMFWGGQDLLLMGVKPILSVARQTTTLTSTADTSSDEAKEAQENWREQFIKLNVDHIIDEGVGVVGGVLLITPSAVMFESNSNDQLVLKNGRESYDVIIPMSVIVGVMIAEDHPTSKSSIREPSSSFEDDVFHFKPEIQSVPTGATAAEDIIPKQLPSSKPINMENEPGKSFPDVSLGNSDGNRSDIVGNEKAVSDCDPSSLSIQFPLPDVVSCGSASTFPIVTQPSSSFQPDVDYNRGSIGDSLVDTEIAGFAVSNSAKEKIGLQDTAVIRDINAGDNETPDLISETHEIDGEIVEVADKIVRAHQVKAGKDEEQKSSTENTGEIANEDDSKFQSVPDEAIGSKASNKELVSDSVVDSPRKRCSTLVGNIFRFHSSGSGSEPSPGKGAEKAIGDEVPNKDVEGESSMLPTRRLMTRTLESLSSYSRPLVDLSSSLFSRSGSDSKSPKQEEKSDVSSFPKFEDSKENDACSNAIPCQRMFFLRPFDRLSRKNKDDAVELTQEAVALESGPPTATNESAELPTLFLCLKIAKSIDWSALVGCPLESLFSSTRLKQEYWFTIPSDKVDLLYAFFLQWSPNLSTELDDLNLEDKGFIVINSTDGNFGFVGSNESTKQVNKEWEIINAKEVRRMINCAEIESLPLPELSEKSAIMDEGHVRELCFHLPPRAEGSSWQLVYSSERNGFSLKTLYRHLARVDSPVLLIIKDDSNMVFGAMLPCALRMSEGFYGSGESYLFSFYPQFTKYAWTGNNNYFIKGNAESVSIGAGEGVYGLWLDGDLYHGRTQPCRTYNNELLTVAEDFMIQCLEVWKFV